jgi:neutral trehalase
MQEYKKLLEKLKENKKWPLLYMFKFIVPNEEGKVEEVKALLPKHGTLSFKHTKNLKFVSITCKASMKSAESIVDVTAKVNNIEGVISL